MTYVLQIGCAVLAIACLVGVVIVQVADYRAHRVFMPHPGVLLGLLLVLAFGGAAVFGDWR